jgi:hypothetical protein
LRGFFAVDISRIQSHDDGSSFEGIAEMAKDAKGAELACSFCGKREPAVKLIAGPSIIICSECVAGCVEIARKGDGDVQSTAGLRQVPDEPGGYSWQFFPKKRAEPRRGPMCTFCGRSDADLVQPPSVLGTCALICNQCLQLCQEVASWSVGR